MAGYNNPFCNVEQFADPTLTIILQHGGYVAKL